MKLRSNNFLLIILISTSWQIFATESTIELSKADVYLTDEPEMNQLFDKKITAVRTRNTPMMVNLFFRYHLRSEECVKWLEEPVLIPGHYELECNLENGVEVCEDVWVDEYWDKQKKCVEQKEVVQTVFKIVVLNFTSASKLSANEKELFAIDLKQTKLSSGKFDISGYAIRSSKTYQIFHRSQLHKYQTLYFAVQ